jgi:hypothetical protein
MTGGELTFGAVPARLEEREREITARARDDAGTGRAADRTARRTRPGRRGSPDHPHDTAGAARPRAARAAGTETAGSSGRPADHGGVHRGRPPAAGPRQVCEAMDLAVAPNNINNVRLKPKRLAGRGILTETEPGLFTQPRP